MLDALLLVRLVEVLLCGCVVVGACLVQCDDLWRTEALGGAFDEARGGLRQPAAVLAAAGADQLARMWSFAGADNTDVVAARLLTIDGAVELHFETDQRRCAEEIAVHGRTRSRTSAP